MTKRTLPENARLIPENAKKMFTGKIFDVYQWQQEMFDGSFETFEMLRRPDTIMVIALDGDRIVTIDEQQPGGIFRKSHLPAGRVDPTDASVEAAARRELLEETGLVYENWRLLEVVQPEPKIEWFVHTFVATGLVEERAPAVDAGEKMVIGRSNFDEVRKRHMRYSSALAMAEKLEDVVATNNDK